LVGQSKNNLGRMNLPTLAFHIVAACVVRTAEGEVWTGKLEWLGETRRTIKDAVMAAAKQRPGDDGYERGRPTGWSTT
jgi:hypothetical protein